METYTHTRIHIHACTDAYRILLNGHTCAHARAHTDEDQSGAGSARHRLRPPLSTPDVPRQRAGGPLSSDSVPSKERERISCPEAATVQLHPRARARMHACRRRDEAWTAGIQSEASMGPQAYTTHIPIASRRLTDEASIGHQGRTVCIRLYRHTLCTVYGYIYTSTHKRTAAHIRLYRHTLPAPADARAVHPHIVLRLQVGDPLDERFDDLRVAVVRGGPKRRPSILHTRPGGRAQHSIAFSSGRATLRGGALQHHDAY